MEDYTLSLVAVGADAHFPYQLQGAVDRFLSAVYTEEPDAVVLLGDIMDCYNLSRYVNKEDDSFHLSDEMEEAQRFLEGVYRYSPQKCSIYYVEGNHEKRMTKYLLRQAPELYGLDELSIPALLGLEEYGITWVPSEEDLRIDGILYRHGDRVSQLPGRTALMHMDMYHESCSVGHGHRMAKVYRKYGGAGLKVGVEVGCLCSWKAAKDYKHHPDWVAGHVFIDDGVPSLHPFKGK